MDHLTELYLSALFLETCAGDSNLCRYDLATNGQHIDNGDAFIAPDNLGIVLQDRTMSCTRIRREWSDRYLELVNEEMPVRIPPRITILEALTGKKLFLISPVHSFPASFARKLVSARRSTGIFRTSLEP